MKLLNNTNEAFSSSNLQVAFDDKDSNLHHQKQEWLMSTENDDPKQH